MLAVPAFALLLLAGACAEKGTKIPPGTSQPDQFLFERGNKSLEDKKWFTAREFFQTLIDTYPQSPHRADAKLGLGDAYLGDGSPASQVLAINEYREFLSFFPTSARADYAQFKLAMCHFSQMAKAGRDQTETLEALKEFDVLFEKYPNSPLLTEARAKHREAKDRLGRSGTWSGSPTTASSGIRAWSRGCRRCSRAIRSSPTATPCTTTSPTRWWS